MERMGKKALLLILYLFVCGIIILGLTKESFVRNTKEIQQLTHTLAKQTSKLSYDQLYSIDQPMHYRIDIDSEDGKTHATLLWPQAPYEQFLILVPYQSEELNTQTEFEGQLVRCVYKCTPGDMVIEMFPLVEMLENAYPTLKGKYSKLPNKIFNTDVTSHGWQGYFKESKIYIIIFSVMALAGIGYFIKSAIKR